MNFQSFKFAMPFLLLVLVSGCAHSVTLNSAPKEAEVFVVQENGTRGGVLGKTPLTLSGNNQTSFEISKSGFASVFVFLPESDLGRDVNLRIELPSLSEAWMEQLMLGGRTAAFENAASDLLTLQSLLFFKKEKEFLALSKKGEAKYGKLALFQVMMGNFYLSKKDYKNAQESFKKALDIDPANKEATSLLKLLKH